MTTASGPLSGTLRAARLAAGLSQTEAARRSGLSQPGVTRFETGMQIPTPAQVAALCKAYQVPAAQRRELVAAARDMRARQYATRPVLRRGTAWQLQAEIGRLEELSASIRDFQPLIVPGLLQTGEYMRLVFGGLDPEDAERAVQRRLLRQLRLRPSQDARSVIPEGVLCWQAGDREVMAVQLGTLAAAAGLGRLGVVTAGTPVARFPVCGFTLYDLHTVVVGTLHGTSFQTVAGDVKAYAELWDDLAAVAAWGEDAAGVIRQAAARYREV